MAREYLKKASLTSKSDASETKRIVRGILDDIEARKYAPVRPGWGAVIAFLLAMLVTIWICAAVAAMLATRPQILIFDEPTAVLTHAEIDGLFEEDRRPRLVRPHGAGQVVQCREVLPASACRSCGAPQNTTVRKRDRTVAEPVANETAVASRVARQQRVLVR